MCGGCFILRKDVCRVYYLLFVSRDFCLGRCLISLDSLTLGLFINFTAKYIRTCTYNVLSNVYVHHWHVLHACPIILPLVG